MKKSGNRRRGGLLARLAQIPEGVFDGVPYMELHGDSSLTVTGYEALLVYERELLMFRMKPSFAAGVGTSLLRITGEELMLHTLAAGTLCVSGRIDAVILHPHAADVEGEGEGGDGTCC